MRACPSGALTGQLPVTGVVSSVARRLASRARRRRVALTQGACHLRASCVASFTRPVARQSHALPNSARCNSPLEQVVEKLVDTLDDICVAPICRPGQYQIRSHG